MGIGASLTVGLRAACAGATALLVTFFLTPVVRSMAVRRGWVARPVEDRWGRRVTARLGGMAMFAGFLIATLLWVPLERSVVGLLAGLGLVFGLGMIDDLRRLPPYTKLVGQLLIGCFIVIDGIRVSLVQWEWVAIPLSILWFVFAINAFNLLDNMDGLAAGVGAIAAGFCAVHAALAGQWTLVTLAAIVTGVCVGFLRFNFPPAKIFMGDSGSHLLGLSLAALALMGSWRHSTQLLSVLAVPTLILAVPIFDTCFVTLQRLVHHQHPFTGGMDHVSHRLAILGLSTRQTVLALYSVSACLGLLSVVTARLSVAVTLSVWVVVLVVLALFGRYLSQVSVYRLEAPLDEARALPSSAPSTLVETMLFHKRRLLEILIDFSLISSAYVFAYLLRFEGVLSADHRQLIVRSLPVILAVKLACFTTCGLYRGVWRYLGLADILTIARAVTLGSLLSAVALLYGWRFEGYSRAVFIIDGLLTFFAVGGARVAERLFDEWIVSTVQRGLPTVVLGAGDVGERVLRYLKYGGKGERRVIGLLDDDVRTHRSRVHGCEVLGGRERLPELLEDHQVREVLIAVTDPPGELLQYVQRCCEPRGVTWRVVTAGVMNAA